MFGALLKIDDLRVDADGIPAVEHLSLETRSDRVLILGTPRILFSALTGVTNIAQGSVSAAGMPLAQAVAQKLVALAPLDPPLPAKWTVGTYVRWSARLSGSPKKQAERAASHAIEKMKLTMFANTRLSQLGLDARRGMILAAALATEAESLLVEDPLAHLPDATARNVAHVIAEGLESKKWAVFAGRMPLSLPVAWHAEEAVVVVNSRVVAQGPPAEVAVRESSFAMTVHGEAPSFVERLADRGAKATLGHAPAESDIAELTVDLAALTTADLFAIAEEVGTVIVELRPLTRAFA